MLDGNLWALNRHLKEQERQEEAFELFEEMIQKDLSHIEKIVEYLFYEANDFEHKGNVYDFTDNLIEMLKEIIEN